MRIDPPQTGTEADQLTAYLDFQRETVLLKTEGLTGEQLARPHPPSSLTLGGLLNHLALVEDSWFRMRFSGLPDDDLWSGVDWDADPDYEFRTAADAGARRSCAAATPTPAHGAGRSWPRPTASTSCRWSHGGTGSTSICAGCCCT